MSDNPPSPSGGGNSTYAVIGALLLLLGGGGIYFLTRTPDGPSHPPPPPRAFDAGVIAPLHPMVAPPIELPPDEPDAGPPVVSDGGPPRIRYVTRFVGGSCNGTIDIHQVQATAQANYGGMRACYEHELRANPQLHGALSARLMITTGGHVEGVEVHTGMASQPLVSCVKRQLQGVAFPSAHGGCAVAEVHFNFTPRE